MCVVMEDRFYVFSPALHLPGKGVRAVFRGGAVISWCCIINPV